MGLIGFPFVGHMFTSHCAERIHEMAHYCFVAPDKINESFWSLNVFVNRAVFGSKCYNFNFKIVFVFSGIFSNTLIIKIICDIANGFGSYLLYNAIVYCVLQAFMLV